MMTLEGFIIISVLIFILGFVIIRGLMKMLHIDSFKDLIGLDKL